MWIKAATASRMAVKCTQVFVALGMAAVNNGSAMPTIPKETIILLSGIPATSKTSFGQYLARERGFAHYDLECDSKTWPHPELHQIWGRDRSAFVDLLRQRHSRTALDWGFPVACLPIVDELRTCGVKLIWFDGDITRAREEFKKRGDCKGPIDNFENQIRDIKKAGYPATLNCAVVPALSSTGTFLEALQIEELIFPPK